MAQFLRVKVPPRVFTAKCSEPQADASNGGGGGSGVANEKRLPGLYVLEGCKRLESETGQRPQGKAHTEDMGNPVPEAGCGQTHRRDLREAQSTDAGMDKLFRHRSF
jgi:hypothetical protein